VLQVHYLHYSLSYVTAQTNHNNIIWYILLVRFNSELLEVFFNSLLFTYLTLIFM